MKLPEFSPNSPTFFDDSKAAARAKLRELLSATNLTIFNFATSSLRGVPIQFVRVNNHGVVAQDLILKTDLPLDPESQAYHGIQQAQVDAAEPLASRLSFIRSLLDDQQPVITFTPGFMRDTLIRGCKHEGLEMFGTGHWEDAQALLAVLCGSYNWTTGKWSKPKLTDCIADLAMPDWFAPLGTALGNAQRLHAVMEHYAQEPDQSHGTAAIGRCERCGLALDECRCFGFSDWEQGEF